MPFIVIGLLIIVLIGGFSYPYVKNHLELKEREEHIRGLLNDSNPKIRVRAEAYVEREKLIKLGFAEAHQAAEILESKEVKELIGGQIDTDTLQEILRDSSSSKFLNQHNI